jgi:hypothetical protein
MSSVLEDFSPIQIGTAGVLGGAQFHAWSAASSCATTAGMWNEWFLLFDDGGDRLAGRFVRPVHGHHRARR